MTQNKPRRHRPFWVIGVLLALGGAMLLMLLTSPRVRTDSRKEISLT